MEKRVQVIAVVAIAGILLAAAYPYMLVRVDEYVRLGTVTTNQIYRYTNQSKGEIVNIIFELAKPIDNFHIKGTIGLAFNETNCAQSLLSGGFRKLDYKTNWYSLSPLIIRAPRDQRVVVSLDITNTIDVPFDLILRYRTYRFPTTW